MVCQRAPTKNMISNHPPCRKLTHDGNVGQVGVVLRDVRIRHLVGVSGEDSEKDKEKDRERRQALFKSQEVSRGVQCLTGLDADFMNARRSVAPMETVESSTVLVLPRSFFPFSDTAHAAVGQLGLGRTGNTANLHTRVGSTWSLRYQRMEALCPRR